MYIEKLHMKIAGTRVFPVHKLTMFKGNFGAKMHGTSRSSIVWGETIDIFAVVPP